MLTPRKKLFCDYYLTCFDGSKSIRMAGYKRKNAKSATNRAYQMLKEPEVKLYIDQCLKKKEESLIIKQDEVLAYLSRAVRGEECDKQVVLKRVGVGSGKFEDNIVEKDIPIKQKDRLKAAEIMARIYKLMDNMSAANNITIVNNIPKEEELTNDSTN
jgi:phage terminase small subunit